MRTLTADTRILVRTPRKTPAKKPLTGDTRIRLDRIIGLKEWHEQLIQDKHSGDKIGTIRRWTDGKLHIKKAHGWDVVSNQSEYSLKEMNPPKKVENLPKKPTAEKEYSDFVDNLFKQNYRDMPNYIRFPDINKKLAYQLGITDKTQFIYKEAYKHINPVRKSDEEQSLTKGEYLLIPLVLKQAKKAYFDPKRKNYIITFKDFNNPKKVNKIILERTSKGSYIVTVSKVNKKDDSVLKKSRPIKR